MRYHVLATDYDGTLAEEGMVAPSSIAALERLRGSGRRAVLVTGRLYPDLRRAFPRLELFDLVVAENGAMLHWPGEDREERLATPPPPALDAALAARGVPFDRGAVIVATREPHQGAVVEAIAALGLELSVIFNRGAVMVLPAGVTKASGLQAALARMRRTVHEVVAVGDGENDHALLAAAELGAAVQDAVAPLRAAADLVTAGADGAGVRELIEALCAEDLRSADAARRAIPLGEGRAGPEVIVPGRDRLLLAGGSGSGKTTAAVALVERFLDRGYQVCVVDPEGEYQGPPGLVPLGTPERAPSPDEVLALLEDPATSPVVNLVAVPLRDRPDWFAVLFPRLQSLRARTGRPHLWVLDEAHHLVPRGWGGAEAAWPADPGAGLLVTLSPARLARPVLGAVTAGVFVGDGNARLLDELRAVRGGAEHGAPPAGQGEALLWRAGENVSAIRLAPGRMVLDRHRRKYAEGDVGPKAFRFRGPEGRLDLPARNLEVFLQLADGVDDDTWRFHLDRGDVEAWLRDAIKDREAAEEVAVVRQRGLPPRDSRRRVREVLARRYQVEREPEPRAGREPT